MNTRIAKKINDSFYMRFSAKQNYLLRTLKESAILFDTDMIRERIKGSDSCSKRSERIKKILSMLPSDMVTRLRESVLIIDFTAAEAIKISGS